MRAPEKFALVKIGASDAGTLKFNEPTASQMVTLVKLAPGKFARASEVRSSSAPARFAKAKVCSRQDLRRGESASLCSLPESTEVD